MRMDRETVKPLGGGSVKRPDGPTSTDATECARLRCDHLNSLLNCKRDIHQAVFDLLPSACPSPTLDDEIATAHAVARLPEEELSRPPYLGEIQAAIDKLKNYKAAGVCRILPEM